MRRGPVAALVQVKATEGVGRSAAMLAYCWAEIGDTVVGTVARRVVVNDRRAKGRRQIDFGTSRILHGFVAKLSDWSPEVIEREYAGSSEIMAG